MKKFFTTIIIVFFLLFWLVGLFQSCSGTISQEDGTEGDEIDWYDSVESVHTIDRHWMDYYSEEEFTVEYSMSETWHTQALEDRINLYVGDWQTDDDFWQKVYIGLYKQSQGKLDFVESALQHIGDSLQLGHDDFARMVVSFVQDIPYNYILPDSCDAKHSDFPCVPNVRFGIHSPIEFLCTLQGDCDTRTILIFTLLRDFGYAPVIINSNEYLHSMIALDIPTSGEFLEYKGKRYAFWETTNVGWLPGMLPPDMNNTKYWHVILDL